MAWKKFLLSCACVTVLAVIAALASGCGGGEASQEPAMGRLSLVVVKFTAIELTPETPEGEEPLTSLRFYSLANTRTPVNAVSSTSFASL